MGTIHSHCSYCGAAFELNQPWPRTCANCGNISYLNPIPVAVILIPTDEGVILIRRGIEPGRGQWAMPGGFVHHDETWQEAGAREVFEETGISIDPKKIRHLSVRSAPDGVVLIFGVASPMKAAELPAFVHNEEATEMALFPAPPSNMAFETHRDAFERLLASSK